MIAGNKLRLFMEENIFTDPDTEFSPTIAYSKSRHPLSEGQLPNVLLTPLMYGYNNPDM